VLRASMAVWLIKHIAYPTTIAWVPALLADPNVAGWGVGLLDQLLWCERVEPGDAEHLLVAAEQHAAESVREQAESIWADLREQPNRPRCGRDRVVLDVTLRRARPVERGARPRVVRAIRCHCGAVDRRRAAELEVLVPGVAAAGRFTAIGWSKRPAQIKTLREGRWQIGYGVATTTGDRAQLPASARATMRPDGRALVQAGPQGIRTGTYTVMTQIAGDALALPIGDIRFELGDTALPEIHSGRLMRTASVRQVT